MNHANLQTSKRLQRLYALLSDGREHSGMSIIQNAHVQAVSAAVSELRANGIEIICRQTRRTMGDDVISRSYYRMVKGAA